MPTSSKQKLTAETLFPRTPPLPRGTVKALVRSVLDRRETFLDAARQHGSPLYVFEEDVFVARAKEFRETFEAEVPGLRAYYAVKSNNMPQAAAAALKAGMGLDVSSGQELAMALELGAKDVAFSGPGKTGAELAQGLAARDRVVLLLDSFGELERLERVAQASCLQSAPNPKGPSANAASKARKGSPPQEPLRAGVRLTTQEEGLWRKFGVPLARLGEFLERAESAPSVDVRGVQFHTSWNMSPDAQVEFMARLGEALARLPNRLRERVEFVDMGGGFWPPAGEWLREEATPRGRIAQLLRPQDKPSKRPRIVPAQPLGAFASAIAQAAREHLFPQGVRRLCAEPGRWVCHDAMHILLTVVDRKAADLAITDGGTNAVGWERYESDYFPVVNLSRPDAKERECHVLGSLCTPHDVWGFSYYGADIRPGDVLLVPCQGAYTYSLRQEFIKPLPKVAVVGGVM